MTAMTDLLPAPVPLLRAVRFAVAGAAGGVGTTTVAALLVGALTARTGMPPHVADHFGGVIAQKAASASPASLNHVHDLGAHATSAGDILAAEGTSPVIVASPDPDACETALFVLQGLTALAPSNAGQRVAAGVVVIASASPKRPPQAAAAKMIQTAPGAIVIPLPFDPALSRPGPVDPARLSPVTLDAIAQAFQAFGV
jgi:MinD-like ATPase involved in chromosome partitioning or flagellar assembly